MKWFYSLPLALGVLACTGAWLLREGAPAKSARATAAPSVASSSRENREIKELERRLRQLEANVEHPRASAVAAAAAPEPAVARPDPDPPPRPSAEERRANRLALYSSTLETEARDARAATEFESNVRSAVASAELGQVERLDCRSTVCVLEIRHADPRDRRKFEHLIVSGPLRFGTYDTVDAQGRTIAYVAMPGHQLPTAEL
jgi:hypothetical protein